MAALNDDGFYESESISRENVEMYKTTIEKIQNVIKKNQKKEKIITEPILP